MSQILKDSRFSKYLNDPRYRQIPKHERKVRIDKRFQSMFSDDKFKVKYTVDKRGRPLNETSTENLRKYYELADSEDDDSAEEKIETQEDSSVGRFVKRPTSRSDDELENNTFLNDKLVRGELNNKTKQRLLDLEVDYARGEGILLSESSSDDESSSEEEASDVEHEWGELDADAGSTDESTKRIAICNMDWDNIKAVDIMVLLNSFLPTGGVVHKVTVYPSEFGLKRMQEEEIRGPIELTEEKVDDIEDNGNEEGSSYHMEKLRRYQLNRLKYYYAVVECDSVGTADKLYNECDGMEYESSATKLDMRFIPDDVTFEQEPREVCDKLPDLTKYKPRLFTTTALQQAKVELTWDTTNPNRTELIRNAVNGTVDDLQLKEYLASSCSEDEDDNIEAAKSDTQSDNDDEDPIMKYKKLLQDIEQKEERKSNKDMEMEISWGIGSKEKAEQLLKKKLNDDSKDLTPFEKLLKKRKEKKKEKKMKNMKKEDESELNSDENSFDDVPSDVDMNDPYFAEEFNKPEFKKKTNKKHDKQTIQETPEDEKTKANLELLVDEDDGKAHFSLKKIQQSENTSKKSKRKQKLKQKMIEQKQTVTDFEMDLNDARFSALYNSHLYNIDPSDPNYKKTNNMEKLIQEKLKRRPADILQEEQAPKRSKEDAEINLLIKNIKRKTRNIK